MTTLVPPAVAALYDVARATFPLDPDPLAVRVVVGPDTSPEFAARVLMVAATWDADLDPISVDRVETGAGPTVTETMTVACSLLVGGGDVDYDAWRATAGVLLSELDDALRSDAMRQAVSRARRGFTRWIDWYDTSGGGTAVIADFLVEMTTLL